MSDTNSSTAVTAASTPRTLDELRAAYAAGQPTTDEEDQRFAAAVHAREAAEHDTEERLALQGRVPDAEEEDAADRADGVSDDHLALEFTRRHAASLRYVASWSRWLRWDGSRWRFDEKLCVYDLAREVCRDLSGLSRSQPASDRVRSASTVAAVVRLAQADPRHARTPEVFDADPWCLNTPGGVVDLHTGDQRIHDPEAHLTKCTTVPADASCPTPLWEKFLAEVLPDAETRAFVQRLTGYALTGLIREHAFAFLWGTGANGKGVLLNTLVGIFGDYATVADMATFTVSQGDRHPTDLAMLRGARLVVSQETEEGRRWAESRIKALTGGDPITARFMRADFFTYQPQFKLLIAGNHRPELRNVDEAMRRRLHLIPFLETIPAERRDPELVEKLRRNGPASWPGRSAGVWPGRPRGSVRLNRSRTRPRTTSWARTPSPMARRMLRGVAHPDRLEHGPLRLVEGLDREDRRVRRHSAPVRPGTSGRGFSEAGPPPSWTPWTWSCC